MRPGQESLFYAGAGPLAALLLGAALVPLRGTTHASNLAFAFLVLTLVVAELGGHGASLATALTSALSLDFFLTQPYGRLSMSDKHDVLAFVGLAVSGLLVASLGSTRNRRIRELETQARRHESLRGLLRSWNGADIGGAPMDRALRACADAFPVAAMVLRDPRDEAVWASGTAAGLRRLPAAHAIAASLAESHEPRDAPFPEAGMRIPLAGPRGSLVGRLDVWGNGAPADAEARRALLDLVRLLSILLAGDRPETR